MHTITPYRFRKIYYIFTAPALARPSPHLCGSGRGGGLGAGLKTTARTREKGEGENPQATKVLGPHPIYLIILFVKSFRILKTEGGQRRMGGG